MTTKEQYWKHRKRIRAYNREWYQRNKEKQKKYSSDYYHKNKEKKHKQRKENHWDKHLCRGWVGSKRKELFKIHGNKCKMCGDVATEFHHIKYERKPSSVIPLCKKCHIEAHVKMR